MNVLLHPSRIMNRTISVTLLTCLLLVSCKTTVLTEEDRALPEPPPPPENETTTAIEFPTETVQLEYTAKMDESFIAFTGKKGDLVSHEGLFEKFDLRITLPGPPLNPEEAKVILSIDIRSITTDSDGLTQHLLADDFFDAENYPTATFTATDIQKKEGNGFAITGDLTIRDVTESVTFDAVITEQYMTMTYDLDRTIFGVGPPAEGLKAIDAIVTLEAKIVFE
jgi:polyisoprenoid-binding protein YceI